MAFWNRLKSSHHQIADEPQTKRISTPAGQRLSVILENGSTESHVTKARDSHRASVRKSGLSPALADAPRESMEERSGNSSGYSYSVWSDGEKRFAAFRNRKQIAKRGGWRRLAIILVIIIIVIIALAVGLALGLKKKSSGSSSSSTPNGSQSAETSGTPTSNSSPSSTSTSTSSSSASLPADFPLGIYSLVTFLDTVQTNCTANPSTWTCYPYTDYYTDVSKSQATFNWIISGSKGAYKISSTENPFSITFNNAGLELLDEGEDNERYKFQIQQTKEVSPSTGLTDDNAAVECDYSDTNLQASLYTKKAKAYPDDTTGDGNPSYTTWPFAVLIEQSTAGGQGVPSCYKTSNGQKGDQISLDAQDATSLCSCLYKNWHTPS
ncbi:hypothetical protein K458DRAFT_85222 [Lentithecium fluviatile CBS 122367]|uniref:Tat pathway signal sequence n=1 Tax=Lentithecium fluviatile CBS 122367 TaxID=1168545 RepID=A0A6G1ISF3_9PLEO|nr:hypothetical protein K458DRAFT_85222 [Lentithecium fluviatile CBS 122367]